MATVIPSYRTEPCESCWQDKPTDELRDVGRGVLFCAKCAADFIEERRAALLAAALDVLGGIK